MKDFSNLSCRVESRWNILMYKALTRARIMLLSVIVAGNMPFRSMPLHFIHSLVLSSSSLKLNSFLETFATGGGDGTVSIWDGFNKRRLVQYPQYPTSIASLAFK